MSPCIYISCNTHGPTLGRGGPFLEEVQPIVIAPKNQEVIAFLRWALAKGYSSFVLMSFQH